MTESTALAEVTLLDSVRAFERGQNAYALVAEEIAARGPERVGINSGPRSVADGLSWTQRTALEEALGPELTGRGSLRPSGEPGRGMAPRLVSDRFLM